MKYRKQYLVSIDRQVVQKILNDSLADVDAGKTSLLNVVKALGEFLTAEEYSIRVKGMFDND